MVSVVLSPASRRMSRLLVEVMFATWGWLRKARVRSERGKHPLRGLSDRRAEYRRRCVGGRAVVYRATELRIEVNWRRRGVMEVKLTSG
jgi:hypothetical protein